MAGALRKEQPNREIERNIETGLIVSDIDYENHTIYLNVQGYPVTVICSPQDNPAAYERVRGVLLEMITNNTVKSAKSRRNRENVR